MNFGRCCYVRLLSFLLIACILSLPVQGQTFSGISLQQNSSTSSTTAAKKQIQQQYTPSLGGDTSIKTDSSNMLEGAVPTPSDMLIQTISVHVLGDVANPGIQKVKMTERAAEILKLASRNRSTTRLIQIRRPGEETRYFDLYQYYYFGNLAHNPYVQEGDTIFVSKSKGAVRVEGPVARPGVYELSYEKNLDQIVKLSGGFTSSLSHQEPLKIIRYRDEGNKEVLTVSSQDNDLKSFSIQKGDIVIVPDVVTAGKVFDYSVEQIPGENMVYPTSSPHVFVTGAVQQPGPILYKAHLTVKDYIGLAGATGDASLKKVKIVRDGKTKTVKLDSTVLAGDVIQVKKKGSAETLTYISIISAVASVALSTVLIKDYLKN